MRTVRMQSFRFTDVMSAEANTAEKFLLNMQPGAIEANGLPN
jgi:hypothetical protein